MSDIVTYARQGDIGIITIDNPPVNALGLAVRKGIVEALDKAEADTAAKVILLTCAGRTFIAGADITEFNSAPQEPYFDVVLKRLEDCPRPVVAVIHGTALGGGLETALACHYRIAAPSAKCGQPEVHLGLVPGAGGTQRLPRLIGVEQAARMIAEGNPVPAPLGHKAGLIDEIIEGDLSEGALAYAQKLADENAPLRKIRDMEEKVKDVDPLIFETLRKEMNKVKRGFDAPQRGIDCVEWATKVPFDEGLKKEQEIFLNCVVSDQSRAQRHIFFAERTATKIPDIGKDTAILPLKSAAVIGAGTMGGGIAMNFANAGIPVFLVDATQEMLDKGMGILRNNYAKSVERGRLKQDKMDACMALITPTLNYEDFKEVDIVIEAVFEEMGLKKEVFTKLDATCKPGCILATNTSTLNIDEIAACTQRPESVIGLHFFSPANIMKLLEIVRAEKTSKEVVATSFALAKIIRKIGVLAHVCDGFIGNRMVFPYGREAEFLLEEGALPQQVDEVISGKFGMAMGPFAMSDLAGMDVAWRIRKAKAHLRPKDLRYSAIADKICEMGRYGQKTGAGVYNYEGRSPVPDPKIEALIINESKLVGIERRVISEEEIVERCIYALINEGARILEEGIALRSSDIDVIYVYGYGFPAYRGGPMFYADLVGVKKVYDKVCVFHEKHGKQWEPAPLLKKLAEEGGDFSSYKK